MPRYKPSPGEAPRDWRGTRIEEGQTVIYGATVGRSVALVEAEVVGFTAKRVKLRVIRRAYGSWGVDRKPEVAVGADRLTVVTELPRTTVPTEDEDVILELEKRMTYWHKELVKVRDGVTSRYTEGEILEMIDKHERELAERRPTT